MNYYRNLIEETIQVLEENGKRQEDVRFVTDGKYRCTWPNFVRSAANYTYDSGYGGAEVNEDLKVVGIDWWLERHEYDGSEWWEFKTLPKYNVYIEDEVKYKYEW